MNMLHKATNSRLVLLTKKNSVRRYFGYFLIIATVFAFVLYAKNNPDVLTPLRNVAFWFLPFVLLLYFVFLLTNFSITLMTIRLCKKAYGLMDGFQLTIYSTLVNFFGPLQSGPGFRAIYLKKKLGIKIKDYTTATLFYYFSFAVVCLLMLFGPLFPLPTLMATLILAFFAASYLMKNSSSENAIRWLILIFSVTALQLFIMAFIFYIELSAVGYTPSIKSSLIYTGSASLALFVSITPGAIGIRESFILFSQSLHNIPTETILNASLLDRSVYLIFLAILFLLSSSLHLKSRLELNRSSGQL